MNSEQKPLEYLGFTAAEWLRMAEHEMREHDSFTLLARLYRKRGEITAAGGMADFPCLMRRGPNGPEKLVAMRIRNRSHKRLVWILNEPSCTEYGRKFIPYVGDGSRTSVSVVQKRLGVWQSVEPGPAEVFIDQNSRGTPFVYIGPATEFNRQRALKHPGFDVGSTR